MLISNKICTIMNLTGHFVRPKFTKLLSVWRRLFLCVEYKIYYFLNKRQVKRMDIIWEEIERKAKMAKCKGKRKK